MWRGRVGKLALPRHDVRDEGEGPKSNSFYRWGKGKLRPKEGQSLAPGPTVDFRFAFTLKHCKLFVPQASPGSRARQGEEGGLKERTPDRAVQIVSVMPDTAGRQFQEAG